jgi:lipoprotein NlpI
MVEAYGYLAAYEANTEKDYSEAIGYFEKILEVDPGNNDAEKYIAILEKNSNK